MNGKITGYPFALTAARRSESVMLKITTHDDPAATTIQVEGKLVGPWAKELEQVWSSQPADKARVVDLTSTLFIDDEGKRVLTKLFREGAFFRTSGPLTCSIVSEITGKRQRPWRGILIHSLALLLAASFAARAADPDPMKLTLRAAVDLALKENPQVVIANLTIAQTLENQNISRAGLLPQINFEANQSLRRENIQALFGSKVPGFPGHIGPFWATQAGPTGSAPIFDLTALRRWQESKENVNGSRAQNQMVREQNVQLVVSQYLGCLRASADVKAAQSRVDLAKALFDQATDMQKSGVGTGIDTLRANVQYQNERQRLIDAETERKTALFGLARLLNLPPQQPVELADESEFFRTQDFNADQSIERAFTERPEMKTLASQIRTVALQKQEAQDERIPKLTLTGSWALQGLTPTTMIPTYDYEANLQVPLFTGGRIKAQTAVAGIELKKLAQQEADLRDQIALEVKTSGSQLEAARSEVDVANQGVDLAREEVVQARDRFQAGVANNIEVITAQDELARANDNQIAALYRYSQARADLARATGQMETLYAK
ncbi:MAG TPA: TolC family protein [Patescibacteria group bacterium]|nr:TolC family protein [Patescibacteria group bacterium]